eukprot:gene1184-biopygen410
MESAKITKAAVGRFARLGDLYDARRDEFLSINALKIKLEEDDIYEDEANSVDIEFIFSESVSEEIEKLGIDAELSLSILSGLVKIKGSASYLHDQKASAKSVRMTMAYTVRTKSQEIDSIRGKIDKKLLESDEATHVVVGIEWGAKCNITCEYENTENEEITTVKGELEAEIEKLKNMISAKGGTNLDLAKKGMSAGTKFEYHSKCDVSDLSEEIPSSFEAAVKSVINLPSIIKKTNAGKGVPISFALISLQKLRKMCKLESDACAVYKQVEESYIKKCFQVIEQVSNTRQQLYDLISNFKAHADAISMECIEEAHRLKNNFDISESEFKSTLMKILVDIRTGKCDPSIINDALSDFLSSSHSPAVIGKNISKFEDQVEGAQSKLLNGLAREVLSKLRMTKEINILILGETGVGKSTWINALANYLAFQTLNDAKESDDIKVLIPTQFSYTSETGKSQCISVGSKSLNEVLVTGQSATQGPKAYRFFVGKHVISLIDTPGIGDVRGLEQDEKNFESILAHLSYYDEIHGICILLKPNDSRLTVTFRFCITELLTHLHKSAAENIIFCFTNARSTFYRPGDTLPTLKQLVSEYKDANLTVSPQNQFCFDNEAFRFLACLINANNKAKELEASKKKASELQDKLYLDAVDLEVVHLDYPRTVCTDLTCVQYVQVMNETSRTVYKQQCHAHCYLSGIPTECTNNADLQNCMAMNSGDNPSCRQCGHSWKVHMHMTYDLNPVNKSVIDEHVQSLLTEKQDDASRLQSFIQHVKIYCEELKQEQQEITDICAQFGCYLKNNAITPYNDEVDAHLRMMIEGEKRKPDMSQKTIDHLTEMRHKYDQKKQIIMKAMASPEKTDVDFITDPDKVEELKTKLFHLKHNGQSLRNIFEDIQKVRNQYHYSEAQMEPIRVVKYQSKSGGLYESIVGTFKSAKSAFKNLFRS